MTKNSLVPRCRRKTDPLAPSGTVVGIHLSHRAHRERWPSDCAGQQRRTLVPVRAKRFTLGALLLTVMGALVAAFAPTGHVMEGSGSPGGVIVTRSYGVSMFQTNGAWVLVVVSVPVLVALVPVLVRYRAARILSAVLLWIGCVVGMWSIGIFFVPAAIAMTVAAAPARSCAGAGHAAGPRRAGPLPPVKLVL